MKKYNLIGMRFGRLVVVKERGRDVHGNKLYECICDCGNRSVVPVARLVSGRTKSCGCLKMHYKFPVKKDCLAWQEGKCIALIETLCATEGTCKFYKSRLD